MNEMPKLSDLIARLEMAAGADRELDIAIAVATGVIDKTIDPALIKNARASPDDPGWVHYEYDGDYYTDCAKPFTSSIDAALTLVPSQEEYGVSIGHDHEAMKWEAFVTEWCLGETIPLALCIAALKARSLAESSLGSRPIIAR